jgi:hypothetical protein
MNKEDYNLLQIKLSKYHPEKDTELTEWISSIRNAKIELLQRGQPFRNEETIIQVKRMDQKDLPTKEEACDGIVGDETVGVQYHDVELVHYFDERLDAIKLPKPCPLEDMDDLSDYLFIRPDEYALFICLTNSDDTLLIGDPGISKSWFQYKFILFCYRPDLFDLLWGKFSPLYPMNVNPCSNTEGIGIMDVAEGDVEGPTKKLNAPRDQKNSDIFPTQPIYPYHIVRTLNGQESRIFYIGHGVDYDVQVLYHDPIDLKWFTDEKHSTILWEPGIGTEPVAYEEVMAKILATVSACDKLYHQYVKRADMFYMPCPSEIHLRLMGKVMHAVDKFSFPSDDEIRDRVKKYGPFMRIALIWKAEEIVEHQQKRDAELIKLCKDNYSKLLFAINSGGRRLSFRIVRMNPNRDCQDRVPQYQTYSIVPSSVDVSTMIKREIRRIPIEKVKEALMYHEGRSILFQNDDWLYAQLERLFVGYATSQGGLTWMCHQMVQERRHNPTANSNEWTPFSLEFNAGFSLNEVLCENTKVDTLYYPDDNNFPLVDAYWKESEKVLACVKATIPGSHAKPLSVYKSFLQKLQVPSDIAVRIYFLSMPTNKIHYSSQDLFASIQFGAEINKSDSDIKNLKNRFEFYALLPPPSFNAHF